MLESLEPDDLRVLRLIERLSRNRRHVPAERLENAAGTPPGRLARILEKLSSLKLVERRADPVSGYALTFRGLDVLAVDSLRSRGVIAVVTERLGVGKEGVAFLAESPEGETLVLKLHRGGLRSFRRIRVYRRYASESPGDFMALAKLSAEREFRALVSLKREGARVPDGVAWSRHAVVQEYIPGVELYKVKPGEVEVDAWKLASSILDTVRIAYVKVGIVHGDLSEYNILLSLESSEGYVIDWPQYVYRGDHQAEKLLERDVGYVVKYFRRRWGIVLDEEKALRYVKGGLDEL